MIIPHDFQVVAWVGTDETGSFGVASASTPLGISPAVVQKQELAEKVFGEQMQLRANHLGTEHHLIRLSKDGIEVLKTLTPRTN